MKHLFLVILILSSKTLFSQYRIEPKVRKDYFNILGKLPLEFKNEVVIRYREGIGLLYFNKTDTLNKEDFIEDFNSIKIYDIDPITGKTDTTTTVSTETVISENQPLPLLCNCIYTNDTLIINTGIFLFSGFTAIIKIYNNKVKALYSVIESEGKDLQITLNEPRVNEIRIPTKVNFLMLDRKPNQNVIEYFGKASLTTNAYYSYVNVYGFKNDYIHKRMRFHFLFRCNTKSSLQQ